MAVCVNCGGQLRGLQRKYCSRKCKNDFNNQVYQSYLAQQKRGRDRKLRLLAMKGGGCELCGYSKNYAALEFHHIDPQSNQVVVGKRLLDIVEPTLVHRLNGTL